MYSDFFAIGGIGHRDLGGNSDNLYVQSICYKLFSEIKKKYPKIRAISAMSHGADTIFSQAAILHNIQLESVIPFDEFICDFSDEEHIEKYKILKKMAFCKTMINFKKRDDLAYKKSMEWVIIKSDIVIAFWNGKMISSVGGTWNAMLFCEKFNKSLIVINIDDKKINMKIKINKKYRYFKNIKVNHILEII